MNEDEIRQDEGSICELYLQRFDNVCSICGQSLVEEVYYKAGFEDPLCHDCYNEQIIKRSDALRTIGSLLETGRFLFPGLLQYSESLHRQL